jgi:methyl-accepting chemotaxis protein
MPKRPNQLRSRGHSPNEVSLASNNSDFRGNDESNAAEGAGARAGVAGKGFGVVVQEVRALAERAALAAKEIKDPIQKMVDRDLETGLSGLSRSVTLSR